MPWEELENIIGRRYLERPAQPAAAIADRIRMDGGEDGFGRGFGLDLGSSGLPLPLPLSPSLATQCCQIKT